MIPYNIENTIVRNCPNGLPFAININAVKPNIVFIKYKYSVFLKMIKPKIEHMMPLKYRIISNLFNVPKIFFIMLTS